MVYNRHNRTNVFQPDAHVDDTQAHQVGSGVGGGRGIIAAPINAPADLSEDPFPVFQFHASRFPNGVTITDFGFSISAASAGYTVALKKYTSPTDGAPVTVESVATVGAAQQAEDDGTIDNPDIAAGNMLYVDLPAVDVNWVLVWITFTID